jgi:hypothetical protein
MAASESGISRSISPLLVVRLYFRLILGHYQLYSIHVIYLSERTNQVIFTCTRISANGLIYGIVISMSIANEGVATVAAAESAESLIV